MTKLEIACFTLSSIQAAQWAGADRIELCIDKSRGGLTPPREWASITSPSRILGSSAERLLPGQQHPGQQSQTTGLRLPYIKPYLTVPLHIMLRPHARDFVYSRDGELAVDEDAACFESFSDGWVFGILRDDKTVDVAMNKHWIRMVSEQTSVFAKKRKFTFHRAFDECEDWKRALEDVIECGFHAILTSGGAPTAVEGRERIRELVKLAGNRIEILAGGGVRRENVELLVRETGVKWVHSAATVGDSEEVSVGEVKALKKLLG